MPGLRPPGSVRLDSCTGEDPPLLGHFKPSVNFLSEDKPLSKLMATGAMVSLGGAVFEFYLKGLLERCQIIHAKGLP